MSANDIINLMYTYIEKPHNLETLSKNHPFKVYCLKYIKDNFSNISQREMARRLQIGKTTVNKWCRIQNLIFHKHTVNENFFKTWSCEMAYILGYIIADGNVAWNPVRGYNTLTITAAAKDKQHLEKVRKIIQSTKSLLYGGNTNSYRLIVNSKVICLDLMGFGIIPRKSLIVRFPRIPKQYHSHFIRGIIDGDGSLRYFKRERSPYFEIQIYSGSLEFIKSLRKVIQNHLSINSRIEKRSCYTLRYSCTRGKELAGWIYGNSTICLKRKYIKYLEALNAQRIKKGEQPDGN